MTQAHSSRSDGGLFIFHSLRVCNQVIWTKPTQFHTARKILHNFVITLLYVNNDPWNQHSYMTVNFLPSCRPTISYNLLSYYPFSWSSWCTQLHSTKWLEASVNNILSFNNNIIHIYFVWLTSVLVRILCIKLPLGFSCTQRDIYTLRLPCFMATRVINLI